MKFGDSSLQTPQTLKIPRTCSGFPIMYSQSTVHENCRQTSQTINDASPWTRLRRSGAREDSRRTEQKPLSLADDGPPSSLLLSASTLPPPWSIAHRRQNGQILEKMRIDDALSSGQWVIEIGIGAAASPFANVLPLLSPRPARIQGPEWAAIR